LIGHAFGVDFDNHLVDRYRVALHYEDLGHFAGIGRRHFEHGLLGLQLDDRLVDLDHVTDGDEHPDNITRLYVFGDLREPDFFDHVRVL
jgi:hypothetical protein